MSILPLRTKLCVSLFFRRGQRTFASSPICGQSRYRVPTPLGPRGDFDKFYDRHRLLEPQRRRTTLHLSNVPLEADIDKLFETFEQFGRIKDSLVLKDAQGNFSGDVYIQYFLPDYASKAAEAHQREPIQVNGSPVWLEYFKQSLTALRPSPTLHVSGLPDDITMPEIRSFFDCFGPIQNARFGRYTGSVFIDFESMDVAQRIVEEHAKNPLRIEYRAISVCYAEPTFAPAVKGWTPSKKGSRRLNPPTSTVFATNFAKPMLERDIREAFEPFGHIQSVFINYYEDRTSRMIAFIEYSSVEEATEAINAWKSGLLRHLGPRARLDYEIDPVQNNDEPFHTLRISGYSGGPPALEGIVEKFKDHVWRVSHPYIELSEQLRQGKGSSVCYIEFITTDHAIAALEALQGSVVNTDERLRVVYAMPLKAWKLRGGVNGRDYGGDKFNFGLMGGGQRSEPGAKLFHAMERKDKWARLEAIAMYLGTGWKAGNEMEVKQLVGQLVKRRADEKAKAKRAEEVRKVEEASKSGEADSEPSNTLNA